MKRIKARQETVLKKEPIQSVKLPDKKLHHVNAGDVWAYDSILSEKDGHIELKLSFGAGTWWVWPPHWDNIDFDMLPLPGTKEGAPPVRTITTNDYSPAVLRQIERLSKYAKDGKPNIQTKTTFFNQRDNSKMPHRTCNTSSNAMYLKWLQEACGLPSIKSDEDYLPHVFKHGDTIYHGVQTKAIKDFGFETKWMTDRDFPFIKELLEAGFPVVCNILHRGSLSRPTGGHIIMLIAYDRAKREFTAHDPYGTLSSNYSNHNGAFSKISEKVFVIRSQGGYRILS